MILGGWYQDTCGKTCTYIRAYDSMRLDFFNSGWGGGGGVNVNTGIQGGQW